MLPRSVLAAGHMPRLRTQWPCRQQPSHTWLHFIDMHSGSERLSRMTKATLLVTRPRCAPMSVSLQSLGFPADGFPCPFPSSCELPCSHG